MSSVVVLICLAAVFSLFKRISISRRAFDYFSCCTVQVAIILCVYRKSDNDQLTKIVYDIITITVIVAGFATSFQAAFVHTCEVSNITMRPLVSFGVVIHVAVTIFSVHSPGFALGVVANELNSAVCPNSTIMPHAKVMPHFMSDDLIIRMICIQQINI